MASMQYQEYVCETREKDCSQGPRCDYDSGYKSFHGQSEHSSKNPSRGPLEILGLGQLMGRDHGARNAQHDTYGRGTCLGHGNGHHEGHGHGTFSGHGMGHHEAHGQGTFPGHGMGHHETHGKGCLTGHNMDHREAYGHETLLGHKKGHHDTHHHKIDSSSHGMMGMSFQGKKGEKKHNKSMHKKNRSCSDNSSGSDSD